MVLIMIDEKKKSLLYKQTLLKYERSERFASQRQKIISRGTGHRSLHNVLKTKIRLPPPTNCICITFIRMPHLHFNHYSFCISPRKFSGATAEQVIKKKSDKSVHPLSLGKTGGMGARYVD